MDVVHQTPEYKEVGEGKGWGHAKGMMSVLPVGMEGEMVQHSYQAMQRAAGLKINPCRDLCNTPRGRWVTQREAQIIQHSAYLEGQPWVSSFMLCNLEHLLQPWSLGKGEKETGEVGGYSSTVPH